MDLTRAGLTAVCLVVTAPVLFADNGLEVITTEDIEREKPASLMELLRKRGGVGDSSGALSLRGVPKVALYVDGFSRSGSVLELDKVKPQDVARIEIIRGAASNRYGADALGGAIIVTTLQAKPKMSLDLVQGYDSLDSHYSRAIASGGQNGIDLRASFEDSLSNRWMIQRSDSPLASLAQTQTTWLAKRGGDIKASYRNDWLTAGAELNYLEQTRNYGRPNNYNQYITIRPRLFSEMRFGELKLNGKLMYEDSRIDVFRDVGDVQNLALYMLGPETENSFNLEVQADYRNFNAGLVYAVNQAAVEQNLASNGQRLFAMRSTVDRIGVFGGYGLDFFDDWHLDVSGRYDQYDYSGISIYDAGLETHEADTFKQAFNPKLALSWKAWPWLSLRGSAATGFMPPDPATLYFRQTRPNYLILPNPGLRPEQSTTLDFGFETAWQGGKAELTWFYTRWTDKMERLVTAGTPTTQQTVNLGASESQGLEFSLQQGLLEDLNLSFNYTLTATQITKSLDAAYIGNELAYQPRHRINAVLTYTGIKDLTARLNLHHESEQYMDFRNLRRDAAGNAWYNQAYATLDFLLTKKLQWAGNGVNLTLALNNLTDNRFQKSLFQVDVGRVVRGEIEVQF
ncbi:TonB-dependent receptor [Methylomicrobium album]|uniref:Outer membrane receptor protein n=1 Tax=Methylomicrobium album BG8 TaxID=686340 RepID=H8GHT3_METAL|nr:TonB-dependent receptor [Methylomicrobium album]EIC31401.1 outer membrane receptor protein [Methylomicrobium album BG8]